MRNYVAAACLLLSTQGAYAFSDLYSFPEPDPEAVAPAPTPARQAPALNPDMGLPGLSSGLPSLSSASDLASGKMEVAPPTMTAQIELPRQAGDKGVCAAAILSAEQKYGIPENLLLAIGLQEAGMKRDGELTIWPWVVNSHGVGHSFDTRAEAVAFVRAEHASGKPSTDVGCMQINLRWHPDAFSNIEQGFDPIKNAEYAAQFLLSLQEEHGDWFKAAGHYHSATPEHQEVYLTGIRKNLEVAHAQRESFVQLATVGSEQFAKNGVATQRRMRDNYSNGTSRLPPGAYRRQLERVAAVEEARGSVRQLAPIEAAEPVEDAGSAGPWWSAEISGSGAGGSSRSIYSDKDIEPVLPDLIVVSAHASGADDMEP